MATPGRLQVLSFSKLYPNPEQPRHGLFVEARLRQLAARPGIDLRVVAPVPWFPSRNPVFGRYAGFARVPAQEQRHGIDVSHPRFFSLPFGDMSVAPLLMAASVAGPLRGLLAQLPAPRVLDAHFLYPDGVAALLLGRRLGVPVVMTARGNDVTLWPRYRGPRRWIRWALNRCARVVTVSESLRHLLLDLGAAPEQVLSLRNGVDLEQFRPLPPVDRSPPQGPRLLAVGHLIERKDHALAIRTLAELPGAELTIIGSGPLRAELGALAQRLGLAERVHFLGPLPPPDLPAQYSAADALLLSSRHEGMANVMLESLACGTPVVACDIEGVREIIRVPEAGEIAARRTPQALATAIRRLLARRPDRMATRHYAESLGWAPVIDTLEQVLWDAATGRG